MRTWHDTVLTDPSIVNVNVNILRDNLQHWLGDFTRLLMVQFTINEGMSNDAPIYKGENEIAGLSLVTLYLPFMKD